MTCPEGLSFAVEDGIPDLYLPRCDCGEALQLARETPEVQLACRSCGRSLAAKDEMKREQSEKERRLYVARDKRSVLREWDGASRGYWTIPLVASEALRARILRHVRGGKILDMGTGPGLWLHFLQPHLAKDAKIVAADISMEMLRVARRGIADQQGLLSILKFSITPPRLENPEGYMRILFVRADAERPPFRDGVFDCCISYQALQYTNQRTSISQLIRITKPGGTILIGTQPGSEPCGELEYDCDPERIKSPAVRLWMKEQMKALDDFPALV